ncbi:MAG: bifunctional DNA-formamidopyrimidine glycosylase/DNA-(apurinic or apyrimidinic site) lyase [Planctomycetota bacterium]|nr:MAG: bifunctional DNA-formamidopyrimidine glycosylase/DNA-(apurinic or apyrimidinic site) lyase [Planctomycetota bacterium]
MPELPEVETMCRGIRPIVGGRIVDVRRPKSRLQPITYRPSFRRLVSRLTGRRVEGIERLGKRVVLIIEGELRLVIEPRMTGRVMLDPAESFSHVRLELTVERDRGETHRVVFRDVRGLGVVSLLSAEAVSRELGPSKLGPDALAISAEELRRRLGARRSAVKTALLDQKALAGVGNIYASESLHRAKIHPATPCCRLKPAQWKRLHEALLVVLKRAIALQGSTLGDGAYATPDNEAGRFQREFLVYGRAGERCLQCRRGKIRRMVQAQRSTFFCPVCQRLPQQGDR